MEIWLRLAWIGLCLLAAVFAGTGIVRALLRRVDRLDRDREHEQRERLGLLDAESQMPGGRWIGVLERAAVFVTIVAGFPMGLAVVVALKGLGRYPELQAASGPNKGELFIIGTLTSLLWAGLWALAATSGSALLASWF